MTDEEIEEWRMALIEYEMKRQIVEGYMSDDQYFAVVQLPLQPKEIRGANRVRELLKRRKDA